MSTTDYRTELGRRLVAEVAPEELPLFEQTWPLVSRHGRQRRVREDPLGLGLPTEVPVLVTAVVSGVVTAVVAKISGVVCSVPSKIWAKLRRHDPALPLPLPPLPQERLTAIRSSAYEQARKLGMTDVKATALADAVLRELVMDTKP